MSSPRPVSRPSSLLPSALPHPNSSRDSPAASPRQQAAPVSMSPTHRGSYERRQQQLYQHGQQQAVNASGGLDSTAHAPPAPSAAPISVVTTGAALDSATYPPPFQPFFTLVEDGTSQNTIHPSVTYIFADDDQEALTNAAIQIDAAAAAAGGTSFATGDASVSASNSHRSKAPKRPPDPSSPRRRGAQSSNAGPEGTRQQPGQQPGVPERCVLVTLGPDGRSVASAVSLTPDWHVDGAELAAAPTLEGDAASGGEASVAGQGAMGTSPGGTASRLRRGSLATPIGEEPGTPVGNASAVPDGPLMLKISGSGVPKPIAQDEALALGIDGLCDTFRERLADLRRVVEAEEQAEQAAREREREVAGGDGEKRGSEGGTASEA